MIRSRLSICQVEICDPSRQVSMNADSNPNLTANMPDSLTSGWGVPQLDTPGSDPAGLWPPSNSLLNPRPSPAPRNVGPSEAQ